MDWSLQRKKNNVFLLMEDVKGLGYSYTSIVMKEEAARKLIKLGVGAWKKLSSEYDSVEMWELRYSNSPKLFEKMLKRFFEVVKEHSDEIRKVPNKRFKTTVPGTSRLVRSKDKSKIYIAKRLQKGKINENNTVNTVCIDNYHRDLFFKDSTHYNGYPTNNMYYLFNYNADVFNWWSNYIDKEYESQYKEYIRNKKNK